MSDYNPRLIVKDGPFVAPRQWHHVLKVLTSLSLYAVILSVTHVSALLAALIAGPLLIVGIQIKEAIRPSDPAKHTLAQKVGDTITDTSLASSTIVLALCSDGQYFFALCALIVFAALYLLCRHEARP